MTLFLAIRYGYGEKYLFHLGLGVNSDEGIPISLSTFTDKTRSSYP